MRAYGEGTMVNYQRTHGQLEFRRLLGSPEVRQKLLKLFELLVAGPDHPPDELVKPSR